MLSSAVCEGMNFMFKLWMCLKSCKIKGWTSCQCCGLRFIFSASIPFSKIHTAIRNRILYNKGLFCFCLSSWKADLLIFWKISGEFALRWRFPVIRLKKARTRQVRRVIFWSTTCSYPIWSSAQELRQSNIYIWYTVFLWGIASSCREGRWASGFELSLIKIFFPA